MRRSVSLVFFFALCAFAPGQETDIASPNAVIRVATAMNHLTVLEFHEPVTMAAAGSSDFQIERESNKVFIKPIKSGAATDLFVWTASQRFTYELEIAKEAKGMNFAIDSARPVPPSKPLVEPDTDQFADIVLTRALMGAEEIQQKNARKMKGKVSVRVEQVFRTRTTLYVHYTIANNSGFVYRVNAPEAYQLRTENSSVPLPRLAHTQLDGTTLDALGETRELSLRVIHAEAEAETLQPGETTQGVIPIRQVLESPTVVELVFNDGVKATFVL